MRCARPGSGVDQVGDVSRLLGVRVIRRRGAFVKWVSLLHNVALSRSSGAGHYPCIGCTHFGALLALTAVRKNLAGVLDAPVPFLWNVEKRQ
jgi:cytochrome c biogenesis protein CcdA